MAKDKDVWFMPDESDPHQRTWMAFGASREIWGKKLLPEVQRNLATIALTIAKELSINYFYNFPRNLRGCRLTRRVSCGAIA